MAHVFEEVTGSAGALSFQFNGQFALKNYNVEIVNGNRLKVVSTTNEMFSLLEADISEVEINGVTYTDPIAAQIALTSLVHSDAEPVVLTKEQYMALAAAIQAADRGKVLPDTLAPVGGWETGWYTPGLFENSDPGTNYPNQNNLKAKKGFITKFLYNGVTWDYIEYELPKASQNIPQFADLNFPVTNTATEKIQCIDNFGFYQLLDGQTSTSSDTPSISPTIWKETGRSDESIVKIAQGVSNPKKSIVVSGAFQNDSEQNYYRDLPIAMTDNAYLNSIGITKLNWTARSGNVESYWYFNNGVETDKGLGNIIETQNGRYMKIEWYIFSKTGVQPSSDTSSRLGAFIITSTGNTPLIGSDSVNGAVTLIQVAADVFKVEKILLFEYTGTYTTIGVSTVLEDADVPVGFVNGDFAVTGLKIAFADTKEELYGEIIGDWQPNANYITQAEGDARYVQSADLPSFTVDLSRNIIESQSQLAPFFKKRKAKKVDAYNRITIAEVGDSIFGGQDSTWGISNSEDFNNPSETQAGYITGHFPPNMWQKNVAYYILKALQYEDADVKYYNHVASEVTKSGTWSNIYPVGADSLRLCSTSETNAGIQLSFTGAKFAKFIWSTYNFNSKTRRLELMVSTNGGSTFQKISDAGLTSSIVLDTDSAFQIPNEDLKWGNVIISGFNEATNYIFRVRKIDGSGILDAWGFETWSNPRIDVIVTAEGSNLASSQLDRPDRFYHSIYNQDLVIYNAPYLNDLGIGRINNFFGDITLAQSPITGWADYVFYRAAETGLYVNFNNLYLYEGEYLEWFGGAWRKGSTTLYNEIDVNYLNDNKSVFERIRQQGVPTLCVMTHDAVSFADKPFTFDYALKLQKLMLKEAGITYIDLNYYQKENAITGIFAPDGTHLNDSGVELYSDLILSVLDVNSDFLGVPSSFFTTKKLTGNSNTTNVDFGFEFKEIPTIRIFNNSTIVISSKTKKGFTVTGSGDFDWEAFIN